MHNYAYTMQDDKKRRHLFLRTALSTKNFSSQEEVALELTKRGFTVNQASISRDFRDLKVIKRNGFYKTPAASDPEAPLAQALFRMIIEVAPAGDNLLVVKTTAGGASAVAEEIDLAGIEGFVGTVAGDNTIFIATQNKASQKIIRDFINSTLGVPKI